MWFVAPALAACGDDGTGRGDAEVTTEVFTPGDISQDVADGIDTADATAVDTAPVDSSTTDTAVDTVAGDTSIADTVVGDTTTDTITDTLDTREEPPDVADTRDEAVKSLQS